MEVMKYMAMTLKAARINVNLKQEDAAKALGITQDTLSNWENGKTFPNVPQIKKIEELYGLPYSEIIFLVNN